MIEHDKSFASPLDQIKAGIRALCIPGQTYEIRVPKAGRYRTISGYFDNLDEMADAVHHLSDGRKVPAVYVTINPVEPALLARAANQTKDYAETTTADRDIPRLRRLLIDGDPVRQSGISSTDEQHEASIDRMRAVREHLRADGWPEPLFADSGNGAHLIYAIDVENTPENVATLKGVLQSLDKVFSDNLVKVDLTTFNPARICKVPGTVARKGDHTPDRPHRRSRLLESPGELLPVPLDLLRKLSGTTIGAFDRAATAKGIDPHGSHDLDLVEPDQGVLDLVGDVPTASGPVWDRERLEGFLAAHNVEHREPVADGDRLKYVLDRCVFDENHVGRDAAVFLWVEGPDKGRLGYKCFHDSCSQRTWTDFREVFDPKDKRKPETTETSYIDDLIAREEAKARLEQEPKPGTDALLDGEEVKELWTELTNKGIEVLKATIDKNLITFKVKCKCCGGPGRFVMNVKTGQGEYHCLGRTRATWKSGMLINSGVKANRSALSIAECLNQPAVEWQLRHHWKSGDVVLVYGPSSTCKSFFVLDVGLTIATGRPFQDTYRTVQGPVAYVVGEGQSGIASRIKGWLQHNDVTGDIPFVVIPHQFNLATASESEAMEILRIARERLGCDPSFIAIDTLNRHFGPGNENDTADMTAFVQAVDLMKHEARATVCVVHHEAKTSRGSRGAVALPCAADTIIHCTGDNFTTDVELEKVKEGEGNRVYTLRREKVDIGDDYGSLVLVLDDSPIKAEKPKPLSSVAEDAVEHHCPVGEGAAITKGALVQKVQAAFSAGKAGDPPGVNKLRTAVESLAMQGRIKVVPHKNENHRKFYKPASQAPEADFFGS